MERVTVVPWLRASEMAPALTLSLLPLWILRLIGSSSQPPAWPCGAETSGAVLTSRMPRALVSTKPPSPDSVPPRAEMVPWLRVTWSAHTTT